MVKKTTKCRDQGSNQGPPDLQSDALPTELSRRHPHHILLIDNEIVFKKLSRKIRLKLYGSITPLST